MFMSCNNSDHADEYTITEKTDETLFYLDFSQIPEKRHRFII